MDEPLKIRIRDINPHIVCSLCAGYFIEATTITECLHTFCKSCVVKFLQNSKVCPQCNLKIHETQPLMNLKADRVMQDIVFKLVPGLYEDEEKRKQEFYKSRGLLREQKEEDSNSSNCLSTVYSDPEAHYYRNDEMISFCLEKFLQDAEEVDGFSLHSLSYKFVRCSVRACVFHVKQLLYNRLAIPRHLPLDVICGRRILDDFWTLKQVWLSQWTPEKCTSPMMVYYRIKPKTHAT